MNHTAIVSEEQIAAFQRDGAVCLRHVLAPEQIELLRAGIDWNLAHPSPRAKVASAVAMIPAGSLRTSAAGRRTSTTVA
jgi:hypothetical protein